VELLTLQDYLQAHAPNDRTFNRLSNTLRLLDIARQSLQDDGDVNEGEEAAWNAITGAETAIAKLLMRTDTVGFALEWVKESGEEEPEWLGFIMYWEFPVGCATPEGLARIPQ
jgi:hypothetical protein